MTGLARVRGADIGIVVGAAGALGVMGRVASGGSQAPRLLFALGAVWLATAFAAGFSTRDVRGGAARGALVLLGSVVVYYVIFNLQRLVDAGYAFRMIVLWGAAALPMGALFGLAGAAFRSGRGRLRTLAATLLGGALAGDALVTLLRGEQGATAVLLGGLVAVGLAIPLGAEHGRRNPAQVLGLTAAATGLAVVADVLVRHAIHRYGWGGY